MSSSKMSSSSFNQLEIELLDAGKKLLQIPPSSSHAVIHNVLAEINQILSKMDQYPSELLKSALRPITKTLIAKKYVGHPDMVVNISVACCFCEILRIYAPDPPYNHEQLKDIFEMIVVTFEKLYSASGGCYTKMAKVLEIFSKGKFSNLMLDLESDAHGLIVRLFEHFLTVADSNSSELVLNIEEIMTMFIEESDEIKHELVGHVVTFLKNNNPIASPVSWKLGEKVLLNFGARSKHRISDTKHDMSISLYEYSRWVTSICKETTPGTTEVDTVENIETHKMIIDCLESARRFQHEENTDSLYDPPNSLTDGNRKRKRNTIALEKQATKVSSSEADMVCIQGYKVKQSNADILEAIFKKHGDIAAKCIFKASMSSSILEVVCKVVRQIQTNNVIDKPEEIECEISDAEAANVDVTWLRAHFQEKMELKLLLETKKNNLLAKCAARKDLEEAEKRVKVLDLLDQNLNDTIMESQAKLDSLV